MEKMQFSAEEFVENLLNEGDKIPCDETLGTFNKTEVPTFYDEKLIERGRMFYHENMFSIIYCTILGGICIAAQPDFARVLKMTDKSTSDLKSYKRYLATLLHILLWYDMDFQPGSRFLASIAKTNKRHNTASKQSSKRLNYRINQKEMVVTQVALVSLPIIRRSLVGIHNTNEEDLKGFIHIWRVIGSLLGIEDRFNACRDSLEETKQIFEIVLNKVTASFFENPNKLIVEMLGYFINGVSTLYPLLEYDFCMTQLQMLFENQPDYRKLKNKNCRNISLLVKIKLIFNSAIMNCLKFRIIRLCARYFSKFLLWMTKTFPLLAYIKYGVNQSHVNFYKEFDSNKYK